jgi:hypothetical protein
MTVWWATPTLDDIAAQRAMIERGEEKGKASKQASERERLRDTFAAAALTGLLAAPTDKDRSMDYWARLAYEAANAMLRERGREVGDGNNPKMECAVTEPLPKEKRAEVSYESYEKNDEKRCFCNTENQPAAGVSEMDSEADRKSVAAPRACARSCSQPFDSAPVTQVGPAPAADGTDWPTSGAGLTLTDEERQAIETAINEAEAHQHESRAATLRNLLERTK